MYYIGAIIKINRLNQIITDWLLAIQPENPRNCIWAKVIENKDNTRGAISVCKDYLLSDSEITESASLPSDFKQDIFPFP